jgi:hypothetical protein
LIPHDVVSRLVDGASPVRAWREYLALTPEEVAGRLKITTPAYLQQELARTSSNHLRKQLASALGIYAAQLDI